MFDVRRYANCRGAEEIAKFNEKSDAGSSFEWNINPIRTEYCVSLALQNKNDWLSDCAQGKCPNQSSSIKICDLFRL